MRLYAFTLPTPLGPLARLGALAADGRSVIDLNLADRLRRRAAGAAPASAAAQADALVPPATVALVQGGPPAWDAAREALAWAETGGAEHGPDGEVLRHTLADLTLLPAVQQPPVFRDFMAFEGHLLNIFPKLGREIPEQWYELPAYYKANVSAIGAHGQDIAIPPWAQDLDWELEIGAVVGTGGADIAREDAASHIFGYCVYNDLSERGIQQQEMAVGLGPGKGKDFRGGHVLGPCLVTADEIDDVYGLRTYVSVNGDRWEAEPTSKMHWRFEDLVAHASRFEPLAPGEVLGSGTVGFGSGMEKGLSLGPGDTISIEVEQLGVLTNRIVR